MANSSPFDGSVWPTTLTPTGDEPHGNANQEIYDLRQGIKQRMDYEHEALTGSADPAAGGRHKAGSAVAFFQDTEPDDQVGGATTLMDSGDNGRLWVDKDGNNTLHVFDSAKAGGAGFETCAPNMDGTTLEANSNLGRIKALGVDTAQLAEAAVTLAKLGTGAPLIEIGEIAGTGNDPLVITGLGFNPEVLFWVEQGTHGFFFAFKNESANPVDIHDSNQSNQISPSNIGVDAVDFDTTGFKIKSTSDRLNHSLKTYSYFVLAAVS